MVLVYSDQEIENVTDSPVPQNESGLVENWDFVEVELLARSFRKAYGGHEKDHVLKPFINRLNAVSGPSNQVALPPPTIVCTDPDGLDVPVVFSNPVLTSQGMETDDANVNIVETRFVLKERVRQRVRRLR